MFTLRCTKRLLTKLGTPARPDADVPRSTTRLGDWYANLIIVRREHVVLAVSGVTLLPVLLPAAPHKTLTSRLPEAVREMLGALGIERAKVEAEVDAMTNCVIAPTNSRQVLGTMNEFTTMLDACHEGDTLTEVALWLAEVICGPIKFERPADVTKALFGRPVLRLVKG